MASSSPPSAACVPLEVPIWLRSRAEKPKWVSGLTGATTCGDVLASVLRGRGLDLAEHVLVEQWRGVERPLANAASICRIWSGWGDERDRVRLVVKRMRIRGSSNASAAAAAGAALGGSRSMSGGKSTAFFANNSAPKMAQSLALITTGLDNHSFRV